MSSFIRSVSLCSVLTVAFAASAAAHDGDHDRASDIGPKGGSTVKYAPEQFTGHSGTYASREASPACIGPKGGDTHRYHGSACCEATPIGNGPAATAHADRDTGPKGGSTRRY